MKTLWQKKHRVEMAPWALDFTTSEDRTLDQVLLPYDVAANMAQIKHLLHIGLITPAEFKKLFQTLLRLNTLWKQGRFKLQSQDEDVHSAVEKYLVEKLGDTGRKIHAGRSRNDQVLTDIRLYAKDQLRKILASWLSLAQEGLSLAGRYPHVFFPGMTHTQPAMPTSVDAWVLGYLELLLEHIQTLIHTYKIIDACPLGSGAGFGVPHLPIDRAKLAHSLGFSDVQRAVTAAQLSRGVTELRMIHALSYTALLFNRMASDVILFNHPSWGWVRLSDDQVSGSSMMPQKRNPDVWEWIRAGSHAFAGWSSQLYSLQTNLISGYHRDLQATKGILISGCQAMERLSQAVFQALQGLDFDPMACHQALTPDLFATHRANELTQRGIPFRKAYQETAQALSSLQVPKREEIKDSYHHEGSPGRGSEAFYRKRLDPLQRWLRKETRSWNRIQARLFS